MYDNETSDGKIQRNTPGERNLPLSNLPETIRRELPARLIKLQQRSFLARAGEPLKNVYFPLSGVVALRTGTTDVALVGYEGIVGSSIMAGNDLSLFDMIVDLPGVAFEVPGIAFSELLERCEHLRRTAWTFEQTLTLQIAQRFLGARLTTQEARLAHHLAMYFDRIDGSELVTQHSALGNALAIRRAGITDALHVLEGRGAISAKRNLIELKDLDRLRDASGVAYGPAEAAYERLFGFSFKKAGKANE
jgi:CRP-like cAMP-binding protein